MADLAACIFALMAKKAKFCGMGHFKAGLVRILEVVLLEIYRQFI